MSADRRSFLQGLVAVIGAGAITLPVTNLTRPLVPAEAKKLAGVYEIMFRGKIVAVEPLEGLSSISYFAKRAMQIDGVRLRLLTGESRVFDFTHIYLVSGDSLHFRFDAAAGAA